MARRHQRTTEYSRAAPRPRAHPQEKVVDWDDIEIEEIPMDDADYSYLEQEGWEDRLEAFQRGDFYFVGIRAKVNVVVNDYIQRFTSPGLWGVESDSGRAYFEEVADEERTELIGVLHELGIKVRGAPRTLSKARRARLKRNAPGR